MADGILINTFKELEPSAIEALEAKQEGRPTIRAVGPLVQIESKSVPSECLDWLDDQPSSSVVFISFGSGGTLSHDQIIELAFGLEMSEQRFLWVLRCPNDMSANATYFSIQNSGDPLAYLPQGFLEKTKGRGLVVPMWAPQAQILAHESTGVFLSHCGWNSTLESVVNGVPLIAWPLYAEQKMNSVMLHEEARAALMIKVGENGLVGRIEVANVVKALIEGEEGKEVRSRVKDLMEAAAKDLSDDGSSTKALVEFANKWTGMVAN